MNTHIPHASQLIYGCMGLGGTWDKSPLTDAHYRQACEVIETALDAGITVFDHADIYTLGKAERVFGEALRTNPDWRDKMVIQSKCGIRFADETGPKRYDFSPQWIVQSINGILTRLGLDYLDILLLHRPDPLVNWEQLGPCLNDIHKQGKFRFLGVSNMHAYQIELMRRHVDCPIITNQIEMSLQCRDWVEDGITTGNQTYAASNYASGTMEYCQLNGISLQAWGSLAQGRFSGNHAGPCLTTDIVAKLASQYAVSKEAIVLAWLTRLPCRIHPIIGTVSPERIKACAEVSDFRLTRAHWYSLLEAVRGAAVP